MLSRMGRILACYFDTFNSSVWWNRYVVRLKYWFICAMTDIPGCSYTCIGDYYCISQYLEHYSIHGHNSELTPNCTVHHTAGNQHHVHLPDITSNLLWNHRPEWRSQSWRKAQITPDYWYSCAIVGGIHRNACLCRRNWCIDSRYKKANHNADHTYSHDIFASAILGIFFPFLRQVWKAKYSNSIGYSAHAHGC